MGTILHPLFFSYHQINCFRLYLALIPSDVTVDYNAPLPCVRVPLSRPGAGGDGELLDLQLNKLANERHN